MSVLEINDLTKTFGGLTAISRVNMNIERQEIIGLIGPNGAGKSTLFNLLTGVYQPTDGTILFEKEGKKHSLPGNTSSEINNLGVARTFQNIRLFKELSVIDNVRIGFHNDLGSNLFSTFFRTKSFYESEKKITEKSMELLEIFNMEEVASYKAKNLPYGEQRKLEIVRALATEPKLLFLDEPAAGMNEKESQELTELIKKIHKDFDLTILLIEHDMKLIMDVCERIYVLEYGKKIAEGTPQEIQKDEHVIRAYLGGE